MNFQYFSKRYRNNKSITNDKIIILFNIHLVKQKKAAPTREQPFHSSLMLWPRFHTTQLQRRLDHFLTVKNGQQTENRIQNGVQHHHDDHRRPHLCSE